MKELIKAKIVQLRGLGYSLKEIGEKIGYSYGAVRYQLQKVREETEKRGKHQTWEKYLNLIARLTVIELTANRERELKKEMEGKEKIKELFKSERMRSIVRLMILDVDLLSRRGQSLASLGLKKLIERGVELPTKEVKT